MRAGQLVDKYELVQHLAVGGMANVYLARVSGLGGFQRHVVLKTLPAERITDDAYVTMFLDEARLIATLHHPHVAQVHDVGVTSDGTYYLAMEYVHGETAQQVLETAETRGYELPLEFGLTVACAAAAGLHHAHERRTPDGTPLEIVHRDVSPSNLIVSYDGTIKLIDFGIAKAQARATHTESGLIKGKAGYMAPEQARGYPVDRRSDVFALGVLAYELTTQARAFHGESQFETIERLVHGEVVPPSQHVPDYPPALEQIVMTALEVDPDDRFQDADEMRRALEQIAIARRLTLGPASTIRVLHDLYGQRREPWLVPPSKRPLARGTNEHPTPVEEPPTSPYVRPESEEDDAEIQLERYVPLAAPVPVIASPAPIEVVDTPSSELPTATAKPLPSIVRPAVPPPLPRLPRTSSQEPARGAAGELEVKVPALINDTHPVVTIEPRARRNSTSGSVADEVISGLSDGGPLAPSAPVARTATIPPLPRATSSSDPSMSSVADEVRARSQGVSLPRARSQEIPRPRTPSSSLSDPSLVAAVRSTVDERLGSSRVEDSGAPSLPRTRSQELPIPSRTSTREAAQTVIEIPTIAARTNSRPTVIEVPPLRTPTRPPGEGSTRSTLPTLPPPPPLRTPTRQPVIEVPPLLPRTITPSSIGAEPVWPTGPDGDAVDEVPVRKSNRAIKVEAPLSHVLAPLHRPAVEAAMPLLVPKRHFASTIAARKRTLASPIIAAAIVLAAAAGIVVWVLYGSSSTTTAPATASAASSTAPAKGAASAKGDADNHGSAVPAAGASAAAASGTSAPGTSAPGTSQGSASAVSVADTASTGSGSTTNNAAGAATGAPMPAPSAQPDADTVMLDVTTDPVGATVVLDGERLGTAPFHAPVKRKAGTAVLKVRMHGRLPIKKNVTLDGDVHWDVHLPVYTPPAS